MSEMMSTVVSALRADQSRLEQASVNASNASTPGYRRGAVVALSFDQVMNAEQARDVLLGTTSRLQADSPVLRKITDFSPGGLQQTGRSLDVAIEGKGFIALTDGNRTWLTRTASLAVDASGDLVGPKGWRVVGVQGNIRPGSDQGLSINAAGEVSRGEQVVGALQVVAPEEGVTLSSEDGVFFEVAPDGIQSAASDQVVVRAGFLEGSNTNSLKEMLSVMESVRHFESLIRLAQGYDEVLGKAIQKLGEV
jgi:flagellar basal-body rod protein FlgF